MSDCFSTSSSTLRSASPDGLESLPTLTMNVPLPSTFDSQSETDRFSSLALLVCSFDCFVIDFPQESVVFFLRLILIVVKNTGSILSGYPELKV